MDFRGNVCVRMTLCDGPEMQYEEPRLVRVVLLVFFDGLERIPGIDEVDSSTTTVLVILEHISINSWVASRSEQIPEA